MIKILTTQVFGRWLNKLKDKTGRAIIVERIHRVESGNFGDCKSIGGGAHELRIAFGPGYRVYFARQGNTVVILLCGGDKDSQQADIARARELAGIL